MKRSFTIPIQTVSAANKREHPMARHDRVLRERKATWAWFPRRSKLAVPAIVTLVRCAPRELDDDNLRSALKAVRDEIARALKVDDRDPRIEFRYGQHRGIAAVLVEIEHGPDTHVRATCPDTGSCAVHRGVQVVIPSGDPGRKLLQMNVTSATYPARRR